MSEAPQQLKYTSINALVYKSVLPNGLPFFLVAPTNQYFTKEISKLGLVFIKEYVFEIFILALGCNVMHI